MGFEQRPGSPDKEPESSDNQEVPTAREHAQDILDEYGRFGTESDTVRRAALTGIFPNFIGSKYPAYLTLTEKMVLGKDHLPKEVYEISLLMGLHRIEWHIDPEGDVWTRETLTDRTLPPRHWERAEEYSQGHLREVLATEQKEPIKIATPEAQHPADPTEDKPTSAIRRILDLVVRSNKPNPIKLPVRPLRASDSKLREILYNAPGSTRNEPYIRRPDAENEE